MNERLAAADAALKAGQIGEAIAQLSALLEKPIRSRRPEFYRSMLVQCYRAGQLEEGARWGAIGVQRYPRDVEILNVLGVIYRRLFRYPEALEALELAAKLAPNNAAVLSNLGNVLLDTENGARGEAVFSKLTRMDPRNAEYHRQLGRALGMQGKRSAAMTRLRQAIAIRKDIVEPWLDLVGMENEEGNLAGAEAVIDRALVALPDHPRLLEARAIVMRRAQQLRRAEAYLLELLPRFPSAAWLQYQLGCTVADYDRDRGNVHLRKAYELDPAKLDHLMALIESVERTRAGDEGANIEEAYQLTLEALTRKTNNSGFAKILFEVLVRVCAFDDLDRVGDFATRGREWAIGGRHTALLKQMAHVKTLEDRYELVEQHRIWARLAEAQAEKTPIKRPPPRPADGRIRLGIMSSDLRSHPVAYFALPLFDHVDRERFDVYCYSFYQGERADRMQEVFAAKSKAFHWKPDINARDAAQAIADDQLDILFELGGSTHMNKLEVMAFKPAPKQASWMGYPHSAGLSSIDYFVCDPYNIPPRRDLLIEQPMMMPHTWLALGRAIFSEGYTLTPGVPEDRHGHITFGTANNPHKYNPETFALWSQVLMAVPGSTFMFIRPEGGTATFRKNVIAEFGKHGVAPERVQFSTIRGMHMPFYNEVDITLDPFPLTGGTTTTESLWMGVPVVNLVGEAFYERLSGSLLANCGLADLTTEDPAEYVRIAANLAADRDRRLALRHGLREQIRNGPLGQTEQFAADFYDVVARTIQA